MSASAFFFCAVDDVARAGAGCDNPGRDRTITFAGPRRAFAGIRSDLIFSKGGMVELRGIEPLTSSLRTRRSPN